MIKKMSWMTLFSVLCFGISCSAQNSGSWRYKLTLVIDDNGVQRTGSSVVEVDVAHYGVPLSPEGASQGIVHVKGEATVVDLGNKGKLFAVLGNQDGPDYAWYIVFDMFPLPGGGGTTPEGIDYYSHLKASRDVPFNKLPLLIHFKDIKDPKTAELVDPNNLTRSFGSGVKLSKVFIEMTEEPVTKEIDSILPSWKGTDFNKWQASLQYGNPLRFDRSRFERNF